jgi:hypothetical protein
MVHMQLLMVAMSSGLGMPLTGTSMNDDLHACVPNQHTYFIHLLTAVVLNTFVVRLYYADGRTYTFQNFESTADGVNWSEVLPTCSQRSQTFSVAFPDRLVKTIRLRATNTTLICIWYDFRRFVCHHQWPFQTTMTPFPVLQLAHHPQ